MNWDRLLTIAGLTFGLPGFLLLFFEPTRTAAILAVLLALALLAGAYVAHYLSTLPPYTMKTAAVSLVIKDKGGKNAHLSKEYEIRPNYSHLTTMTHRNIAADGETNNICWNDRPVPAHRIRSILGEYEVTIEFPAQCKRWHTFKGKLSYDVEDSFLGNPEGLVYVADFPTKLARIHIDLPQERPCSRAYTYKVVGAQKVSYIDPDVSSDKARIELEIKRPRIGSEYMLYWDW